MKRWKLLAASAVLGAGIIVVPATSAWASGCAVLQSTWYSGNNSWAKVYNACGTGPRYMRATVPGWPDPDCKWIGSYSTADFRVGGSVAPRATGAVEC
jgi:hypothetical protein